MRVLVTGGAGFIGANLSKELTQRGNSVTVLDDLSTGFRTNLAGVDVQFIEGSILDDNALQAATKDIDAIVHLAARPSVPRSIQDPVASHETNATGTVRVLEAARRAGNVHVIVASSSSVYGDQPVLPKHEGLAPAPRSPYAASKLATESYTIAYGSSFALPVLAFRFFNVFGPLQAAGHAYAAVIPAFVSACLEGRPLPVFGDGKQTRDFTYVGTVVAVICDALERKVTSERPVNLAFGTRSSLLDVIERLEAMLGSISVDHRPDRAGDVRDSQADTSQLRELFPHIEPVQFEQGLQQTIEWYRSTMNQKDGR